MSVLYSQCLPGKCFTLKKKILFCARALPKGVHVSVAAKITVIAKGCTRFCVSTLPKGVQAIVQSYSWRGIPSFNVCDLLIQSIKRGSCSDGWGDCSCDTEPITMGALKNKFPFNFLLLCKILLVLMVFPILRTIHASTKCTLPPIKNGESVVCFSMRVPNILWISPRACQASQQATVCQLHPTLRDLGWMAVAEETYFAGVVKF